MFNKSANTGRITMISQDKKFAHDNGLSLYVRSNLIDPYFRKQIACKLEGFFLRDPPGHKKIL